MGAQQPMDPGVRRSDKAQIWDLPCLLLYQACPDLSRRKALCLQGVQEACGLAHLSAPPATRSSEQQARRSWWGLCLRFSTGVPNCLKLNPYTFSSCWFARELFPESASRSRKEWLVPEKGTSKLSLGSRKTLL